MHKRKAVGIVYADNNILTMVFLQIAKRRINSEGRDILHVTKQLLVFTRNSE